MIDINFRIAPMDKPDKPEKSEKVDKLGKSDKPEKKDALFAPDDSKKPAFLDVLDEVDPDLTERLALEAGAVAASLPTFSALPTFFTPLEDAAKSQNLPIASLENTTQSVSTVPVFFPIPQSEILVPQAPELPQGVPQTITPTAFPQWLAGEVKRVQQEGAAPLTQITVQLDPPHLGEVQLTVSMLERHVSVEIAALPQAKPLIEPSLGQIRAILTSMNLTAGEVKLAAHSKNSFSREGEYPQQNRWARKRPSDNDNLSVT